MFYNMKHYKPISVGIDFDGVLAYNPFRVIRAPITFVKRNVFKNKKTEFYIPQNGIERTVWKVLHESSIFPAQGVGRLQRMVDDGIIEAHLVTARYSFLRDNLFKWLDKHQMKELFTSITINDHDEQPHLYKARVINENHFDYFIEDNLDVVDHLIKTTNTNVLWIYNILDRRHTYPTKFPYLGRALDFIAP
jgi:hypothetical protein